ncbi:MAG: mobile mystery protein B [Flavobacteriaceae bacterium]
MGLELKYEEGQTPLNEEEKEGLKIKSITTQGELDEFEQLNIEKAVEWTIHAKLKPEKILTEKFVKDLHKKMYGDVWKWAGEFRKSEKNIGISWVQISIELKNLLDDTKYWIENNTYSPDEIAIRFKHRIVSIHCFPNGNGRHSRMMADIIMESIFDEDIFTWHQSKMVKANETRKEYINALREADNGNVKPLIEFAKN